MKTICRKITGILLLAFMLAISVPSVLPGQTLVAEAASIKISSTKLTLSKGAKKTLKISGTSKKVTWSSSKKSVATVSSSGKVTAKKKGTATITAKVGNKKYTCKVTVESPSINMTSVKLTKKGTVYLKLSGTSQTVKWTSSKKSVASVSSEGLVTAKKSGTAKIKASVGGMTYTCTVKVVSGGISVSKTSLTVAVGQTKTVTIDFTGNDYGDITFGTDTSIVEGEWAENWNGSTIELYITGVSAGSTTIEIACTNASEKKTINVTVTGGNTNTSGSSGSSGNGNSSSSGSGTVDVTGIALSNTTLSLEDEDTYTLTAVVSPSNATDKTVTWSSSNTDVATVSSSGKVKAVSVGSAVITAKAGNKTASCVVKVTVPVTFKMPEVPVTISAYSSSGSLRETCTVTGIRCEVKKSGSSYYYKIYLDGVRNYYYKGSNISSKCRIGFKIYNSSGAVVDSGTIYSSAVCEGEAFAEAYTNGFIAAGDYEIVLIDLLS